MFQMDEYLWRCDLAYEDEQETKNEKSTNKKEVGSNTPNDETYVCETGDRKQRE